MRPQARRILKFVSAVYAPSWRSIINSPNAPISSSVEAGHLARLEIENLMTKIILLASAVLILGGMGTAFAHPPNGGGLPPNIAGPVYGAHAFDNPPSAHQTGETVFSRIFGHSKSSQAEAAQSRSAPAPH
jgi:hypothetical protein